MLVEYAVESTLADGARLGSFSSVVTRQVPETHLQKSFCITVQTQGAIREAEEEVGLPPRSTLGPDPLMVVRQEIALMDHGMWKYTYIISDILKDFEPRITDNEGIGVEWVRVEEVHKRPLHEDFADAWPRLLQIIYPSPVYPRVYG
ncbi:hypothetical protein VMCG_07146 [Cytospora schulzeri]|uniref:Nudix hydrolase domain-containing protein n=1 Tax=Cytospora schulzeri TaxID=448051 RepID=A0A423W503_9PEZI|nr:hypothetical protein VMCG_07146 [Valsa malicola]